MTAEEISIVILSFSIGFFVGVGLVILAIALK